jgi:hypothetical protein
MIRHIVAFRLVDGDEVTRAHHVAAIKERLTGIADAVPGVLSLEVHGDLGYIHSHWPVVLIADFESNAVLEAYQAHPRHQDIVQWMDDGVVIDRAIVDFEVTST